MSTNNQLYHLRVKEGSLVETLLSQIAGSGKRTKEDIIKVGGQKQSIWVSWLLSRMFDNVTLNMSGNKYLMSYTDVIGTQGAVYNISQADFSAPSADGGAGADHEDVRWPGAPKLLSLNDYSFYRKPSYFKAFQAMVRLGKHIALSGPPSVGKDTDVEYLAALEGKPLVTVSGDAGLRKRDLIGSPEMVNGSSYFLVSEFAAAVVKGWWACITEVNAAEPDSLLLLNSVAAPPYTINIRGRMYPVHPDFRLFITFNPGLIGTKPLPQAFRDRFYPIQIPFLNRDELRERLIAHGMPGETVVVNDAYGNSKTVAKVEWVDKALDYAMLMRDAHVNGKMRYHITVRRLIDAVTLMNEGITTDIRRALKWAVIGAIDSPPEAQEAERILSQVIK